jgi:hypothetical protein
LKKGGARPAGTKKFSFAVADLSRRAGFLSASCKADKKSALRNKSFLLLFFKKEDFLASWQKSVLSVLARLG